MSTINFTITASLAEFSDFADRLGYMSNIKDGNGDVIQNPESKQDFLTRILKESVSSVFYTSFVKEIEQQVVNTRDTEKEAVRENIRGRVDVTFTP